MSQPSDSATSGGLPETSGSSGWLEPPAARRKLGGSAIEVSAFAWGHWRLRGTDIPATSRLLYAALDAGIDLIDTADVYGLDTGEGFGAAEALLGRVLAAEPGLRQRLVLATKGGISPGAPYDSSKAALCRALDASLRRLGTEQVELWQIHRPDILTHPAEVAEAVSAMHRAGKIACFGVSNHTTAQIGTLRQFLDVPLVSTQPEFSPLTLNPIVTGELDQAIAMNLAVLAWSPLGGGRIAQPTTQKEQAVANLLDEMGHAWEVSRAAAALSWVMAHPARPIPIIGTMQAQHIAAAVKARTVRWSRQTWYAVLAAAQGSPLP